MGIFKLRENAKYDIISMGEIMLRLDPAEGRIKTTRHFNVWEGGGEYNVARGLRRCFNMKAGVISALAENQVGRLVEDLILQGGVDTEFIKWFEYDGVGRTVRNGLNFTERGFGLRNALGVSDRGMSAVSQLKAEDIDFEYIFGELGVRWFHTGGILAGLSDTTPDLVLEAVQIAKKYGTIVSYDLNYRPSLWKSNGGMKKAQEINNKIAPFVDVMIGNEEDFTACLGFEMEGNDFSGKLNIANYEKMIKKVVAKFPNFKVVATTLRGVKTATINDWSAIAYCNNELVKGMQLDDLEIFDRVGGGDSFASGIIYGILCGYDIQKSLNYGIAHGALAMTTAGDTTMASKSEVEAVISGKGARVIR